MIPVVAASIINRPDLLLRMVKSIDEPIERGLIVDNGKIGVGRDHGGVLAAHGFTVCEPPFTSLGWAGTFNFAIAQTPDAPWWLYVNNDAYFEPGVLAKLVARMDSADGPLVLTDAFTVAALNRQAVETVGLFDEWSFYPIYFEDQDYLRRCRLAGVSVEHGKWCLEGDIGQTDVASLTIKSDPKLAQANNRTFQMNQQAYIEKWGGLPGNEQFDTPWGEYNMPLWATKPAPLSRKQRLW